MKDNIVTATDRTNFFLAWYNSTTYTRNQAAEILGINIDSFNRYFSSGKNKRSPSWEVLFKIKTLEP